MQLFTQDLAAIKTEDDKKKLNIVLQAILQRFGGPYELELIWLIIGNIQTYCQNQRK